MSHVIYVRISRDRTGLQAGVDRQTVDCLAYCSEHGLANPVVLVENDTSAYNLRKPRPEWSRLVKMMERGEVESITAWHADRLYRRVRDLLEVIDVIDAYPCDIHTIMSGDIDLSTASGRMTAKIIGAVAEHESEHKSERIVAAHEAKALRGESKGGKASFGYRYVEGLGGKKLLEVHPVESVVAREAAARILAGASATRTAEWVSDRLGRQVPQQTLVRSLTAPFIAGMRIHWPQRERNLWNDRRRRGEVSGAYPPHFVLNHVVPGNWEPVLDVEVWRELVVRFEAKASRRPPRRSLLAGLLRCGRCDSVLGFGEDSNYRVKGELNPYGAYRCISTNGGCAGTSIAARPIEEWITRTVLAYARNYPDEIAKNDDVNGVPVEKKRASLLARLDEQADAFGKQELTRAQWLRNKERIELELAELDAGYTVVAAEESAKRHAFDTIVNWEGSNTQARAAALRAFLRYATVFGGGKGSRLKAEHRTVFSWVDDPDELDLDERRALLPEPPAPITDRERKDRRNARARQKYAEARARLSA